MRISILCFDLTNNCLGRAHLLGQVLRRRHEVQILGSLFTAHAPSVWPPLASESAAYEIVEGCKLPRYLRSMARLLQRARGDVVYACKPRLPSFGVALLKKILSRRRVLLDIDDLESSWFGAEDWRRTRRVLRNPVGPLYTRWMESLTHLADGITTVSSELQRRFGGVIVPHGRDPDVLDPARFDPRALREQLGIGADRVIMFLGTPRPHKGLEDVIAALDRVGRRDVRFVIVGAGSDPPFERRLAELGGERVRLCPRIAVADVPRYLCAADLVVIPQRLGEQAAGQMPAKLFDAMAMARPIIASATADIPEILSDCGIVVPPGSIGALTERIGWVLDHPDEARALGERARARCIARYSLDAMEERLAEVIGS